MPRIPNKTQRRKPTKMYTKDGSLSEAGKKWNIMLEKCNLDKEYDGVIEEITSYTEPNCQSSKQIKDYLFSLSWKPEIFKDGANGKVPQLRDDDKNLCKSIQKLIEKNPQLQALDGLSVAQHRSSYLKSFLSKVDVNGYAKAWASSFTRTLRLKHTAPFVNLPKPNSQYGELVRSVMVAPKGYKCIGADLSSIEDKCKQISIFELDREYVESMNSKGWDAHLALGLKSGMFTEDEVQFYKWFKNKGREDNNYTCPDSLKTLTEEEKEHTFHILDKKRATSKTSNYALTYGCGVAKLMESADISKKEAEKLHKGYHDINWSVKKFAETRITKKVQGKNWLRLDKKVGGLIEVNELTWVWNEYSKMWLFLKNEKDRFSACNQNFGVKVFDVWSYFLIQEGIEFSYQAHDEQLWYCPENEVDKHVEIIKRAIEKTNKVFNPPIPLECDYKIGNNYSEVH
jgi:DNA polymerase I-like protein with 3'-5' exonuclease and polymerase domains